MGHVYPYPLPECTGDSVRGVDPAVCVQHILGDVFCVDAVYGVAHILPCGDDEREGQQAHHREGVVQPEDGAVDVHVADLYQVLEATEYVQHLGGWLGSSPLAEVATAVELDNQALMDEEKKKGRSSWPSDSPRTPRSAAFVVASLNTGGSRAWGEDLFGRLC